MQQQFLGGEKTLETQAIKGPHVFPFIVYQTLSQISFPIDYSTFISTFKWKELCKPLAQLLAAVDQHWVPQQPGGPRS